MKEIENLANELSKLYNKAKTKKEYKKVVRREEEISVSLEGESFDLMLLVFLPIYWAEYYLLLKFPLSSGVADKDDFLCKVQYIFSQLKDPDNKVSMLYLESVIWSNLLNNRENSDWCNREIEKIILSEEISLASILKSINARIIKEMTDENWPEAVKISKEIEVFSREILRHAENLRHTANIFSNWGASLIRGSIDVDKGREKLLVAKDYYLREEVPPEGHLEGIENRLREADEKS